MSQIDVYKDYLAMAGITLDNSLLGYAFTIYNSYVAMMSVSTSGLFYWAKSMS